ncbi:uncharacterized protein LOC134780005 [Penaeus indicus]|uniref:uncharacterized protein LOC134780005 n=1 Tax=Penaeus indicus TaxID=29960 RepID=UPI00300D5C56
MDPSEPAVAASASAAEDASGGSAVRTFPIYGAVSVIIVVVGGTGNLFLIYLSFKKSKLLTAINQLLLSQCFINLTVCFVGIPIKAFLEASGLVFSARDSLCWFVLSWTYASWANFCFSLCVVASVRLLYTVAPLRMHSLQEERMTALSCGILLLDQLAWFVASILEDEPPFGSVTCFFEKIQHTSRRIIAAIAFNLTCLVITLGTYLGITFSTARHPLPPPATSSQRNLITARTGIIQCVFFLLTYMLPIGTRFLSYQGAISPTTLAQGNFFFVFFFQCSVYPFLTIVSSTILRKETLAIVATLKARVMPVPVSRSRRVEPEVCVAERGLAESPQGTPKAASSPGSPDSRNRISLVTPNTCNSRLASSVFPDEQTIGSPAHGVFTISCSDRISQMSTTDTQRSHAPLEEGGDDQPELIRRLEVRAEASVGSSRDEKLASST